jgi:hypothetical protein
MITLAVEELSKTAKILEKSKSPISGWRDLLTKRTDDIDDYIALYHPRIHKKTETYSHNYIKRYRSALDEKQHTALCKLGKKIPPPS